MYQRYERYKDSGVEWIGEIPEHWKVISLKRKFKIVNGGTPKSDEPLFWNNGDIIWVTPDDLSSNENKVISNSKRQITYDGIMSSSANIVPLNSIIVSTRAPIGYIKIAGTELSTNQGCKSLVNLTESTNEYYYYFLISAKEHLNSMGQGTTFTELSNYNLSNCSALNPNTGERTQIVRFLDQKTSEIDSLIADKEKLIQELQEYKQSIITETVTKGLNPDVKMKDSGIKWIGKVPEHWKLYALKRIAKLRSGDFINSHDIKEDGEFPVYGGNGLRGFTSAYTHEGMFPLIGRQGALCGNINYAHGKFWASEHAVVVSPIRSVDLFWLGELLRAMNLGRQSMSAAQPGLSVEKVRNLIIPVPPKSEQSDIAVHLKNKLNSINAICETTDQSIIKLKQYRQSLIYEAVTGKIDVRDYQPERSEQLA